MKRVGRATLAAVATVASQGRCTTPPRAERIAPRRSCSMARAVGMTTVSRIGREGGGRTVVTSPCAAWMSRSAPEETRITGVCMCTCVCVYFTLPVREQPFAAFLRSSTHPFHLFVIFFRLPVSLDTYAYPYHTVPYHGLSSGLSP